MQHSNIFKIESVVRMLWVELCPSQINMLKSQPPELQSMTLFGNRVTAVVMS